MRGLAVRNAFIAELDYGVDDPVALDFYACWTVGEGGGALGTIEEERVALQSLIGRRVS